MFSKTLAISAPAKIAMTLDSKIVNCNKNRYNILQYFMNSTKQNRKNYDKNMLDKELNDALSELNQKLQQIETILEALEKKNKNRT